MSSFKSYFKRAAGPLAWKDASGKTLKEIEGS